MKKEFIFLGPPACGKGTQTSKLARHFKLPHVDTGSLLRKEIASGSENGKVAKSFIDKGQLVPVWLVGEIIKNDVPGFVTSVPIKVDAVVKNEGNVHEKRRLRLIEEHDQERKRRCKIVSKYGEVAAAERFSQRVIHR